MQQEPWAEPLLLLPSRSPVRIHSVQDGLELRVGLPFVHHGQVIAQGAQTGFELLVVQPAGLVLVEESVAESRGLSSEALLLSPPPPPGRARGYSLEHHAEFFEGLLGHSCRVPGLDLLLQVVLHVHAQLVELVPLLGQAHGAVLRVLVVQDQRFLHGHPQVFILLVTSSYKPLDQHLIRFTISIY